MYRQIIGYVPGNVIPAIVSVVMIYAYTRLLTPAAFGSFTYIFSAVLILQTSLFYALPIAVMRFYPGAARDGRRDGLLKEAYVVFFGLSAATVAVSVIAALLVHLPDAYRWPAWLALPMLLFRSLVQLNQSVNRSATRMSRYNAIECLHALLGFGLGLVALFVLWPSAESIVLGLLIAAVICAAFEFRMLSVPFRPTAGPLNRQELVKLVAYSWPMVVVAATAMIMQNSDRFLLGSISGPGALGIFAVAYSLVDRPTTLICSAISTATFPLVVNVLENQGKEAARLQAGRNGIALLAIALPTCVGLAFTADYIAASLVGPAFRAGAAALIPIMSMAALARGIRSHFIDHAFHLSGQPLKMLWTYVPATVANISLNLWAVPHFGMMGAAWTALICQAGLVVLGWFVGTALFPVWLPVWQMLRCILAVIPMGIALVLIRFPMDWGGLFAAVLMGAAIYVVTAAVLDVGEMRTLGWQTFRRRMLRPQPALARASNPSSGA